MLSLFARSIPQCGRTALPAALPLLVLLLALCMPATAQAHRVNIFAWTEGPQVVAECGFSGGNKVRQGQVTVFDAATGAKLLEGRTDNKGVFRFDIPAEGRTHGLRIRVNAGEGHQNEWSMEASELASATTPAPTATETAAPATAAVSAANTASQAPTGPAAAPGASGAAASAPSAVCVGSGEVRNIVNAALDAKLGPIRRELAEMRVAKPGFREIFGGIGWLVGLAGLALYFKGRRG